MQLLYGPNIHQSNLACYASPVYDAMFKERSRCAIRPNARFFSSA